MEDAITFGRFVVSFLHFFGSRPSTNGIGMGFYHLHMKVEFPHALHPPKRHPVRYRIGSGTDEFVRVHTQQECITLPSVSFPVLMYGSCSPGGLRLKRGIM